MTDIRSNCEFVVDERLLKSSFVIIYWPLSRVLLKNNAHYPWLILVPRRNNITEITQLCAADRAQLMDEIHRLSVLMQDIFQPDKINLGALGNIVSQFHFHIVARFKQDSLWPQSIWQTAHEDISYEHPEGLIKQLKNKLKQVF